MQCLILSPCQSCGVFNVVSSVSGHSVFLELPSSPLVFFLLLLFLPIFLIGMYTLSHAQCSIITNYGYYISQNMFSLTIYHWLSDYSFWKGRKPWLSEVLSRCTFSNGHSLSKTPRIQTQWAQPLLIWARLKRGRQNSSQGSKYESL